MRALLFLGVLTVAAVAWAGVNIISGASTDTLTVNANKAALVVTGKASVDTYTCTATGLATTAAYSMQLDAEVSRGFRLVRWCVGTSVATAAALQTVTVQRRTTASSAGTAATAEGTASPAVSKMSPSSANWSGRCAATPTLGTAGAVLDGVGWTVGEIGAGAADPGSPNVFCKTYGDDGEMAPTVAAGTANGISISATAAGAGGLASGSISMTFVAD